MNAPLPLESALSLYNDTSCRDTGQYFCNNKPFSMPRTGNKVSVLDCGKMVFQNIYDAMVSAEKFIYIADWQLAFDVELFGRGEPGYPGRLHKVIEDIISKKSVHVRVLLFCSINDTIPGTYDGLVSRELNKLNYKGYPGSIRIILQRPTSAQNDNIDYSHHQKFVVIDGQVAFIGGIDMTYGRWETPNFDVVVDPEIFAINEMYNPCATKLRKASDIEKKKIKEFHFAEPYGTNLIKDGKLIDEGCQPRMPWQDVHIKIEGPSVVDIHRNFARRWNSYLNHMSPDARRTLQLESISKAWLDKIGAWSLLAGAQTLKGGGAQVQIVRSVSNRHLAMEGKNPDDLQLFSNLNERSIWQECLKTWRSEHQGNILTAMVNCIRSADNYIYIETQFFISQFGQWGKNNDGTNTPIVDSAKIGNENNGIKNIIIDELAKRIHQHINAGTIFHVYLVLPVHPEGSVSDGSVWKQHWLALTTIKHGSESLINRIKKSLKTKNRNPDDWPQYLSVLNMRSYGATVQYARDPKTMDEDFNREIGRFVVTEQIYIHSKLLIVDDAVAIVGSANINDRSLTGNGDTEIAAVVVDTEGVELRDLGSPKFKVQTRKFARELRRSLWKKHFGFMVESDNYFRSTERARRNKKIPPAELPFPPRLRTTEEKIKGLIRDAVWETMLDKPCAPQTVKVIQAVAEHNARIYEEVFQHTPRNSMKTFDAIHNFYTLPYPAVFNQLGTMYLQDMNRENLIHPTPTSPKIIAELRQKSYRTNLDAAGKDFHYAGVVPPALNSRFMKADLMPYQQFALKEASYARRQQLYTDGTIHDVEAAIEYLQKKVIGFIVSAPLDWGIGTTIDDDVSKHSTVDIAKADTNFTPNQAAST